MKGKVQVIELNKEESGIVVNALYKYRETFIQKNVDMNIIDNIILKVINTPLKNKKIFNRGNVR